MKSLGTYWAIVAAFAVSLVALNACTGAGIPTTPQLPGDVQSAQSDESDTFDAGASCANPRVQPGWVFKGACDTSPIRKKPTIFRLRPYRGFTFSVTFPRGDAHGQHITVVDATGSNDIVRHAGKAFPLDFHSFLYVKFVNKGKPVRFDKKTVVVLKMTATSDFIAPCDSARLAIAKRSWPAYPTAGDVAAKSVTYRIPSNTFGPLVRGERYLSFECTGGPSPSPSPSPTTSPSAPPTPPAFCAPYSTPTPSLGSNGPNPVNITDNSGLGGEAILYVTTGAAPYKFLQPNGQLVPWKVGATAAPLPLTCYPRSEGARGGLQFQLPGNGFNGRLWIAYATPLPSGGIPNPLSVLVGQAASGSTATGYQAPSLDPRSAAYVSVPYDIVEITLPNGVIDTSQVNDLGLPIEMSILNPNGTPEAGPVGVTGASYATILSQIENLAYYKNLPVAVSFKGKNVLSRIIAPVSGQPYGFPQDWYYNPAYGQSSAAGGVANALSAYQNTAYSYSLNGIGGFSGVAYCASSDGTANFIFTRKSSSSAPCPAPTPVGNPTPAGQIAISVKTLQADPAYSCESTIMGQPYALANVGSSSVFPTQNAFYLWKALTLDFNRGTIFSGDTHPVGGWGTSSTQPYSVFYQSGVYNAYGKLLHDNFIGNKTYALTYDDAGGWASTLTANAPDTLSIVIGEVPSYNPTTSATPAPQATPCVAEAHPRPRSR